jgi:hypothetical protein
VLAEQQLRLQLMLKKTQQQNQDPVRLSKQPAVDVSKNSMDSQPSTNKYSPNSQDSSNSGKKLTVKVGTQKGKSPYLNDCF